MSDTNVYEPCIRACLGLTPDSPSDLAQRERVSDRVSQRVGLCVGERRPGRVFAELTPDSPSLLRHFLFFSHGNLFGAKNAFVEAQYLYACALGLTPDSPSLLRCFFFFGITLKPGVE